MLGIGHAINPIIILQISTFALYAILKATTASESTKITAFLPKYMIKNQPEEEILSEIGAVSNDEELADAEIGQKLLKGIDLKMKTRKPHVPNYKNRRQSRYVQSIDSFYQLGPCIGSGNYGKVFRARDLRT